jgi:hypothetical protein
MLRHSFFAAVLCTAQRNAIPLIVVIPTTRSQYFLIQDTLKVSLGKALPLGVALRKGITSRYT